MHLSDPHKCNQSSNHIPQQPANAWVTYNTTTRTFKLTIDTEDGMRRGLILTPHETESLMSILMDILHTTGHIQYGDEE